MANLEKHVKSLPVMLMDSDSNLVPTRARGANLVGQYIKGRRRNQAFAPAPARRAAANYVLRLEGLPATSAAVERVGRRVAAINSWLEQNGTPFRLRVIPAAKP